MQKIQSFVIFAIIATQFTLVGCKKDAPPSVTPLPRPVIPLSPPDTPPPPVVYAGPDIKLEIPSTSVQLDCSLISGNNNIASYRWKKISGPESYFLEWDNLASPKVGWMEEGLYEFAVTVTDNQLRGHSDTVRITVFSNLKKYVINDLTRDVLGLSTAPIPAEVTNNIKWVFAKSAGSYEQADAGPRPGSDYSWGGYYYILRSGNRISVYGGYSNDPTVDVTIYY